MTRPPTTCRKTTLTSPIDGNVIELSREVGERVRGSDFSEDVVMTIAALSAMEVKIEVGEHEVVHLKTGQPAEVTLDALEGESFQGSVVEIAQKALIKNPGTEAEVTTFPVTVALDSRPPGVLPGMSAEVRISAETHNDAVLVPIQAVTVRSEKLAAGLQGAGGGRGAHGQAQDGVAGQGRLRGGRGEQGPGAPGAHGHRLGHGAGDHRRHSRTATAWWRARTARSPRS